VLGFQVVGMVWSRGLCVRFVVEQAIRSAIKKTSVASSWHFISSYDSNLINNRKYYESYAQNKYKGKKTVH
jgi:hypothetical protein